jgi:hypothetical protein
VARRKMGKLIILNKQVLFMVRIKTFKRKVIRREKERKYHSQLKSMIKRLMNSSIQLNRRFSTMRIESPTRKSSSS